ncbi:unnamed protein product [Alternaria alternata]
MSPLEAPFNRLPNELKLQVFEELYQDSMTRRRDYINALKVCRQWNVLGMPLLWTYIPINEHNIVPFVRSLEAARKTTGALFSVDNIEPDENSAEERIQMPATNPFCEALRRRVPHLEHLRIQADEISPFVFDVLMTGPPLPKLQTLVMSLMSLNIPNQLRMQYTHLGPKSAPVEDTGGLNPQADALASLQWQNVITRQLHTSWQAGRFPSATHLLVVGNQDPESIADYIRPLGRYLDEFCLYTVDILLGEMEITPFVPVDHGLRFDHGRTGNEADRYLKTVIYRARDGQLTILDRNAAGIHVCTNRLWKTSTTGIRVVKETKEMSKYDLKWMEPMQQGIPLDNFCERIKAENGAGGLMVGNYLGSTMSTLRGGWIKSGVVEWYNTISDATLERLRQTEEQA